MLKSGPFLLMGKFKKLWRINTYNKNKFQKKICFRSKWEIAFANYIDNHPRVKEWRQDFPFRYYDQFVTKKLTVYYIDFHIIMDTGQNILIEIKPISTLNESVRTKSLRYKKIHEHNYLKNLSKFDSVNQYCRKNKWKFFLVEKTKQNFNYYVWDDKLHKAILTRK